MFKFIITDKIFNWKQKKVSKIYKEFTKRFQYLIQIILFGMFYFL